MNINVKTFLMLMCATVILHPLKSDIVHKSCHRSWDPSCRFGSAPGSDAACSPAELCTHHNMSHV